MALSGAAILFSSIYPILSYEWEASQKYPILISPLVDAETASFVFSERDYTLASNWFDGASANDEPSENIDYYTLSIPELSIAGATVIIGGEDLSESLVQFAGTAPPGKIGNAVIFGHSILPQYFNPENYLSIFSTLPTLDVGDEIFVNYDGISYKYLVESMFEVKPEDIQILEQPSNGSYLSLVTCTPPGHPLKPKRLIVRAKLTPA